MHIVRLEEAIDQYKEFTDTLHSALLASYDRNIEVCRVCTEATKSAVNAWVWSLVLLVVVFLFLLAYVESKKK